MENVDMDEVVETVMTRRKRMFVLEEVAAEASKGDPPPEKDVISEKTSRPASSASRSFRRTAGAVSKANIAIKSNKHFKADMDEFKVMNKSLIYQLLKPLFMVMAIHGIFFYKKKKIYTSGLLIKCFGHKHWSLGQIYAVVIASILVLNAFRSLLSFDTNDGFNHVLFFKLLWILKWYQAASTACLFVQLCWPREKKSLSDFFFKMQKICYSDNIIPYEHALRTGLRYVSLLFVAYVILNVAIPAYAFFGPTNAGSELFQALLAPIPGGIHYIYIWQALVLLFSLLSTAVISLSMVFYFVMCYLLYKEMEYFTRTFCMKIRSDGRFIDDLEKFRIMHQKRCKLVDEGDDLFKRYIANHYLVTVVLVCLLLFNIVYMDKANHFFLLVVASAHLIFNAFEMMFVSLVASAVHTEAHAPLAYIHSIKVSIQTDEDLLVMNMFLSRLTGTQVGMTAWDMFVINKPAMLTVGGFILTYFFLMVQLKSPVLGPVYCLCTFLSQDRHFIHEHDFVMDLLG